MGTKKQGQLNELALQKMRNLEWETWALRGNYSCRTNPFRAAVGMVVESPPRSVVASP